MTDIPMTSEPRTPEAAFLRDVHAGVCRIFGTVLGPEANEAHRNPYISISHRGDGVPSANKWPHPKSGRPASLDMGTVGCGRTGG
jgi:hypothetical protein